MKERKTLQCPKCGEQSRLISHGKRYSLYPAGCLYVLGLVVAIVHRSSAPVDFECQACGHKFAQRSLLAKINLLLLILIVLATLCILMTGFYRE